MPTTDERGAILVNTEFVPRTPAVFPTVNYTASVNDQVIICDGTFTVTLPAAATSDGVHYWIKNIGNGVITVDGNGSDEIDGQLTQVLATWETLEIMCANSTWYIL